MLTKSDSYRELYDNFQWQIPETYNIAADICDKWVTGTRRRALVFETHDGRTEEYSFDDVRRESNKLANVFASKGITTGDRVAVLLPQHPMVAFAHLAAYRLGAIAVPLFTLFGPDALAFRLKDSGAKLIVTDSVGVQTLSTIRDSLPDLLHVLSVDSHGGSDSSPIDTLMDDASDSFETKRTHADDPALIIYTSGTTGDPKGALLPHRSMLGHMPGVEFSHDFLGQCGDLIWSPADWAWIGGLVDVLFAAWQVGVPVLARRFEKFDPELAARLLSKYSVRNVFMPPTALKLMRSLPSKQFAGVNLRSIASGGESLGEELQSWSEANFGVPINEFYGQTECNMTVSACSSLYGFKPGKIGRAAPGHRVEIIDKSGNIQPHGEIGDIAVLSPNPVMFLRYWNNERATAEKFLGDWLVTGDIGVMDEEGDITFVGRDDDVITSAGYRIGPGPIEDCLIAHPQVQLAAVVGKPDATRTQIVKAYVVLRPGLIPESGLVEELKEWVKIRLSKHEYPREIAFVDELPRTNTGKIIRRLLRD